MNGSAKLTGREADVLELIARGFHNREIAEALCISVETVNSHVDHILIKLSVSSRAAAAAWWVQQQVKKSPD
jgi:non-specific serine/threonine protein kinase